MEEINLYDLLRHYAKNWLNILIALMAGAILGLAYTFFVQTPMYKSEATLLAVGEQRTSSSQDSVVLNNYVGLFTSQRVLGPVIHEQAYDGSYSQLVGNVAASNDKGTDIINVSIATRDANKSKAMLEGAIESFREQSQELYGDRAVTLRVVDNATLPGNASNVKPLQQVGLAMAVTATLTAIVMFFMYDYRMANPKKTQKTKNSKVVLPIIKEKKASEGVFSKVMKRLLLGETPNDQNNK